MATNKKNTAKTTSKKPTTKKSASPKKKPAASKSAQPKKKVEPSVLDSAASIASSEGIANAWETTKDQAVANFTAAIKTEVSKNSKFKNFFVKLLGGK